jgi:hypothetical protein
MTDPLPRAKCIVAGCVNHKHEGLFVGDLCGPCFQMLTSGDSNYGNTFIHELQARVKTLERAMQAYERERNRYRHANPEYTGTYFLSGGHGAFDSNCLPQYVRIVPAYGCAWEQIYEKTDRTVSYEGS